jgi:uncharacterized protein YodC (DUF2158 family)
MTSEIKLGQRFWIKYFEPGDIVRLDNGKEYELVSYYKTGMYKDQWAVKDSEGNFGRVSYYEWATLVKREVAVND